MKISARIKRLLDCVLILASFTGEQINVFRIPIYCYILIIDILFSVFNRDIHMRNKQIKNFLLFWFVSATFLLLFFDRKASVVSFFNLSASIFIVYMLCYGINDMNSVRMYALFAGIGLAFTVILSLYEIYSGNHIIALNEYYARMGIGNAFGFQVNVNDNATVLVIAMFTVFFFIRRKPIICMAILIMTLYVIYRIGARMAFVALICGTIAFFTILVFDRVATNKPLITKYIVSSLVTVLLLVFFLTFDESSFLDRISNPLSYRYDSARIFFIKQAIKTTANTSMFLGNGSGVTQSLMGYSIHSMLVEILCDYGVIVFIWFCVIISNMMLSFANRADVKARAIVSTFTLCFVIMSFCSSSMLRIKAVWSVFAIYYCYYALTVKLSDKITPETSMKQQHCHE